jgi:glucose/mannose-6-phosphate isomerase
MNLNNQEIYKKYDLGNVAESISFLPDQLEQAFFEAEKIEIPKSYKKIDKIVVNGMGGSNLGARIIESAMSQELKVPLLINPGYEVPGYVNKDTLYIISSYSGNTEEPLSVYREVKKRKAKIMIISSDEKNNKLRKIMKKDKIPGYLFKDNNNPSDQPRLGVGYTVAGTMMMIKKAGLLKTSKQEIKETIDYLKLKNPELVKENKKNKAKEIALKLNNKIPVIVSSEFLSGNVHVLRNQFNECSKLFSTYLIIPELNHYAMEGLLHPKENKKNLVFLFFESDLFNQRNKKRMELTKKVVVKNKIDVISEKLKAETKLGQAMEFLQLGTWLSYYSGILYKVDPINIPWVNWFKKELK